MIAMGCPLGGTPDSGERVGVHVERETWIHPHLPLQPWYRSESGGSCQATPARQGNTTQGTVRLLITYITNVFNGPIHPENRCLYC